MQQLLCQIVAKLKPTNMEYAHTYSLAVFEATRN